MLALGSVRVDIVYFLDILVAILANYMGSVFDIKHAIYFNDLTSTDVKDLILKTNFESFLKIFLHWVLINCNQGEWLKRKPSQETKISSVHPFVTCLVFPFKMWIKKTFWETFASFILPSLWGSFPLNGIQTQRQRI